MNRQEKEHLCIKKMRELQLRWENQLPDDWDFVKEWSDEELDARIKDTIAQL